MSGKNNNHYAEINALSAFLFFYCYYLMKKQEEYNNFYSSPVNTITNWAPITLSGFLLFLTSTTSLILSLNPGRSNFNEDKLQKSFEKITMATPGLLAVATDTGFKVAKIIAGERAVAAQEMATEVISHLEEALRFLVTLERIHAHQMARSFEIENERYLSLTAYRAHEIDKAFILTVESIVEYSWRTGLYKFLTQYFNIKDKDTLKALATLYFFTDILELIGTKTINNMALAAEIIFYGEDKTQYYKIEDSKAMQLMKSFAHKISEGIRAAEEELKHLRIKVEEAASEIKAKILEIANLNALKEAAEEVKQAVIDQLKEAKESLLKLEEKLAEKVKEVADKILEIANFKKAYETMKHELDYVKNFFKDQIPEMERVFHQSALTLQSNWRGYKERANNPKIIEFLERKKAVIELPKPEDRAVALDKSDSQEHEHHDSFFGNLFHLEGNIFSSIRHGLHIPSSSQENSKTKESSKVAQKTAKGGEVKTDKADLGSQEDESSYFSFVAKKMAEFSITLVSSLLKEKHPVTKNKERQEYEQAKMEAEKSSNNNIAIVKYENLQISEKPANQSQYYKNGQELLEMAFILEGLGVSMLGEGEHYNQGGFMLM
jgi:hypothetical protein